MDPNYGGGLDEQNWQFSVEDFESLYEPPQIPDSCDPCDSLNASHFQSGDLGSQSVTGTELPGFPQGPISGYDPDLSEFLDPAGINQDNQAIAGRPQPDLPQG
ncbi:hypothetical protein SLEP1_g26527 [Rubroshorea leprosula]|uniref:Uncharacterized protein n=1 Tax=Rubroshorea leprosula TaxID=152421 RepID=A0AAV5JY18_9ROSI|nr:hypothetical protein SLEP1_g26527 [Rubroshorea leprosula]